MGTERLYYGDSYLTEFDATVLAHSEIVGRPAVALDRSAFYPEGGGQPGPWALVVMGGTAGFLLALAAHAWIAFEVALAGVSPAFPPEANARFLTLATWGFVVPFVFARPAGLIASASPSDADATAAPPRDVDTAPEPGR